VRPYHNLKQIFFVIAFLALYCFQFQEKVLMNAGKYCKSTFTYIFMLKNVAFSGMISIILRFKNLPQPKFFPIKNINFFFSYKIENRFFPTACCLFPPLADAPFALAPPSHFAAFRTFYAPPHSAENPSRSSKVLLLRNKEKNKPGEA
jgi:hypothetical protein